MTSTLTTQTSITIQIIIQDDSGALALSVWFMVRLFSWLWRLSRAIALITEEVSTMARDITTALKFTWAVLCIIAASLAFGLGISK